MSIWGERAKGRNPSSSHSIAKAGVHQLTKNIAQNIGYYGVNINTVAPGVISESATELNNIHALGNVENYTDAANMIFFLADDRRSNWITGSIFNVEGGASALINNDKP